MVDIRISGLPNEASPSASDVLPIDGATTRKTTIQAAVEIGRPVASQAEAEAGTDPTKAMTPLTTAQAIAAQGATQFASAAQGAKADTALQPAAIGTTVQAFSANLLEIAAVNPGTAGKDILADETVDDVYTSLTTAVWTSGTTRTMKARATDTYCILDAPGNPDPTGVNDSTTALVAMIAQGIKCEITKGDFICTQKLVLADGQYLTGFGGGYLFNAHSRILMSGTGTKEHAITGATAITIANPSAGEAYLSDSGTRGNNYSTVDLTSNFSAAIILGKGSKVENLGIYPLIAGSMDAYGNEASNAISDDWDVGIWARNADAWRLENVIVAGHWRKYAFLTSSHDIGDGKVPSNEKGRAVNCHFQGFRGVGIRTPETVIGSNYGFAGTIFDSCDFRPLQHQSAHLATSSFLATPFASPSGCLEIAGDSDNMRGIKWYNATFIGRDDICIIATAGAEMMGSGCYLEAQNIKIGGVWQTDKEGSRMVGNSNASAILFDELTAKFAVDFSPYQIRDSSLTGKRYTASGVWNPTQADDGDYSNLRFSSKIGRRLRSTSQAFGIDAPDSGGTVAEVFRVNATGQVIGRVFDSGTLTVNDDNAADLVPLKKGGMCAITFAGNTEDSNFASPLHSGIFFYDVGTATFSATKYAGGANFICVNTDVTGTTGTDGNVTIGVKDGIIRVENRQGGVGVFRYTFVG